MARNNMILILAGCVMLASVCMVQADKTESFKFSFYQHVIDSNDVSVFGPSPANGEVGKGYIFTNSATKTTAITSQLYGNVSGLFFYVTEDVLHEVSTIKFEDITKDGGRFGGSTILLRGLWYLQNGEDQDSQELAIVGGTGGLARAYGTVKYEKEKGTSVYKVTGEFKIDYTYLY